jgi:hypothetical protein
MVKPFRRTACNIFGIVFCVYIMTTGGSFATDLASYEVTKNLVQQGSVAMSYNVLATAAERGVDGRYYAPVGLGHPVFGVPFYFASRVIQRGLDVRVGKPETLDKAAVVLGSAVAAALCAPVAFLFAWRLSGSVVGSLVAAFGLAFGTILWPYSKFGFNAPLAAFFLLAATYCTWLGVRSARTSVLALGGTWLGCALLTRHEMALMAIPLGVWIVVESMTDRPKLLRRCMTFGVPVAVAVGVWMWYNFVRFGHPFDTGLLRDPNVQFDTPLLVGLYGLLASPGRSLFLYVPIAGAGLLALKVLAGRDWSTAMLFGGQVVMLLFVVAKLHQWDGGESYGPRYLIPVLPFLTIPIAACFPLDYRPRWRRFLPIIIAISILVQLPGILVDYSKMQQAFARRTDEYSIQMSRYTWPAAPLTLNTRAALQGVPRNIAYLLGISSPPDVSTTGQETQRDFSQQFSFSLDFWWLYLFYLGALPAGVALVLGLLPLLFALRLVRSLYRSVHGHEVSPV